MDKELLIETLFFPNNIPIQNQPFKIGFRVENKGEELLLKCSFENIKIISGDGRSVTTTLEDKLQINNLVSGEMKDVWINSSISTPLYGLASIYLGIASEEKIVTYQKDRITGDTSKYKMPNKWEEVFYIESILENSQKKTNKILIILTFIMSLLTLIMAMPALKEFLL